MTDDRLAGDREQHGRRRRARQRRRRLHPKGPGHDRSRRARRLASRCGWCELVVAAQVAVELRDREGAAAVAGRVDQAPDEIYAELELQFSPEEIAALTFQIVAINGWNRLAVGLRTPVGDYVSPFHQAAGASA
jgi:hypothetical protein